MKHSHQQTITRLLRRIGKEKQQSFDELFKKVYDELYERAHQQRNLWRGNHTLNTTALLHEAYLKLVDQDFDDKHTRAHFYATASKAMRHILINYARDKRRKKRGGSQPVLSLDTLNFIPQAHVEFTEERSELLLILENALEKLHEINPRQCTIIECRFFGGMTIEETATALGVSSRTVLRSWKTARLWLYREMQKALD